MIDRVAPSLRPKGPAAGTQLWRRLLFAHTVVDPRVLRPLVPSGLELDLYEGRAYVGLVPFAMRQVRPSFVPRFAALEVSYRVGEPLGRSEVGSLRHFLIERYLLFSERRGKLLTGQVHHSPYPVHAAELLSMHDALLPASGLPAMDLENVVTVHWSPGVDVEVFALASR